MKQTSFTGRVEHEDILGYYSNSDVFLNASRIDNQPLSILENAPETAAEEIAYWFSGTELVG